ncbi:IS110 family transposase [Halomonas piscis]|uniref:IS110 family transposase n=2 Tax=Halomonas TaxID=2745 RepID=A0ABY9Z0B4_9GAMM|nr:IS110 family transposase [Halomonas piscis]WNK18888.1 IS110 family transposase [Halomonas piscis]WNK20061.1 IS110 family transposase [Halomonas piscis]WNK20128.1 IS110 family transposase [Halomonas piscis]WNK20135.1 IS110 family transposase [Halomonas piscis]WNK20155.1 IS110 family transposase [Halomonas piscis]
MTALQLPDIAPSGHIVVGVDTHKHIHVAAVVDTTAGLRSTLSVTADRDGFEKLLAWARSFGRILAFGVEGTGSYGAALTSFIRRHDTLVIEVSRPNRRLRRLNGKSDTLDAENAARAVLSRTATAIPKVTDGTAEMVRQLKVAYDTAVKARTAAMVTLKAMLVHAPDDVRASAEAKTPLALAHKFSRLRPSLLENTTDSIKHTLRSLSRRWISLDEEAGALNKMIYDLVQEAVPQLVESYGISTHTAAEILIVVGDNPERIKSEAALAKLAGISPIPASSGMTSGRYRINRGGHRQLNAAIYRAAIVRMRGHEPTKVYVARRTAEGKTKRDIVRCLKRYIIREVYRLLRYGPKVAEYAT